MWTSLHARDRLLRYMRLEVVDLGHLRRLGRAALAALAIAEETRDGERAVLEGGDPPVSLLAAWRGKLGRREHRLAAIVPGQMRTACRMGAGLSDGCGQVQLRRRRHMGSTWRKRTKRE